MIELMTCLAVGLGLAVLVVLYLALSRRRVARLLATEQAKSSARELAAKAALQERLAADVAVIVAPLRALLEEQARARAGSAADVAQQVASVRALVEWFAAFTSAQYEHARSLTAVGPPKPPLPRGRGADPLRSPHPPPGVHRTPAPAVAMPSIPPFETDNPLTGPRRSSAGFRPHLYRAVHGSVGNRLPPRRAVHGSVGNRIAGTRARSNPVGFLPAPCRPA